MESGILTIGNKIKLYRTRKNISIEDFADSLNVSRQIVSRWEHGESIPRFDTAIDIAKQLDVDLNDLKPGKETITTTDLMNML